MKNRLILSLIGASLAAIAMACGISPASDSEPEVTPTVVSIDLITADPGENPDAFRASLSESEAACYDEATEEYEDAWKLLRDSGETDSMFSSLGGFAAFQAADCYDNDTLQRLYIGQVDRLAGGLSNATLNCMVEHTANTDFSGLLSNEGSALEADNLMSVVQSVFCLDDDERLALETALAEENEDFRTGMIDGLECTVDHQDEDGNFVVQDALQLFSQLDDNDPIDEDTGELRPEVRETINTIFDLVPVMVDCELITDAELADSGMTTDQLVCASDALRDPLPTLLDSASENSGSEMDFGDLAALFSALDECGIDPNDIEGFDSLMGSGMDGMELEPTIPPDLEIPSDVEGMSMEDLEQFLSQEQIACLQENVTEEDIRRMMESGEPPANMFAIMAACDITIDQFIEGF